MTRQRRLWRHVANDPMKIQKKIIVIAKLEREMKIECNNNINNNK